MIAKGKSISHGTAALEYDLAKEINGEAAATEIHRHELFGCTGEDMVQEMKPYFVDFPNVKNNCLRFEVSPSVEESAGMTDADWAKLGNDFMQRMGLMNHQYIIVKHSGTEKNRRQAHLHILANRVSLSGELYQDNWIGKRATEAANSIARERNLVQSKDIGKTNREEIKQAMDDVLIRMQPGTRKTGLQGKGSPGKYRKTQRLLRESPERNGIQGKRDRERLYACPHREDTEKIEV